MTACGQNRSCNTAFVKMLLITTVVWRLLCQHNFMTQQDVHLQDSIWALVLYIQLRDTWYSKTYTHWVLLMLTVTSNSIRHYCWSICSTTSTESDAFLQKIVSGNDVWCHHFQTQKKNCMQWEQPSSPCPKKFNSQPSTGKVTLILRHQCYCCCGSSSSSRFRGISVIKAICTCLLFSNTLP
jgi:hypothetical protein